LREAEVDDEELQERRRPADDRDVDERDAAHDPPARHAGDRGQQADQGADERRQGGELARHLEADQQRMPVLAGDVDEAHWPTFGWTLTALPPRSRRSSAGPPDALCDAGAR